MTEQEETIINALRSLLGRVSPARRASIMAELELLHDEWEELAGADEDYYKYLELLDKRLKVAKAKLREANGEEAGVHIATIASVAKEIEDLKEEWDEREEDRAAVLGIIPNTDLE